MPSEQETYEQMQNALIGFRAHTLPLGELVELLPELLTQISNPDPTWKSTFVSHWWVLEEVRTEAIELGESRRMPEGSRGTVDTAISELSRLIEEAMTPTIDLDQESSSEPNRSKTS